jgi:hypothetical protein
MRHTALFLIAAAITPVSVFAQAETTPAAPEYRRSTLVERGPFARPERGRAQVTSGGPIELRGFFGEGEKLEVSLTKPDTKESAWVKVGDTSAKWLVDSADPSAGTAEVRYDGMRLHLSLARTEEVATTASAPAPEVKVEEPSRGRGSRGNLSPDARNAMRTAMRENMETARKEHPEYFDGSKLTDEQQKARGEYFRVGFEKVRAAVAKVSPEEAAKMENSGGGFDRGGRGGSEQGGGANTGSPEASGQSGSPEQSGAGRTSRRSRGGQGRSGSSDGVGLQVGNSAPAPAPAQAPANP